MNWGWNADDKLSRYDCNVVSRTIHHLLLICRPDLIVIIMEGSGAIRQVGLYCSSRDGNATTIIPKWLFGKGEETNERPSSLLLLSKRIQEHLALIVQHPIIIYFFPFSPLGHENVFVTHPPIREYYLSQWKMVHSYAREILSLKYAREKKIEHLNVKDFRIEKRNRLS